TDVNKLNDDADENEPPRKRALWSDNTSGPREWRERHMFPNECFICHSVKMKPYKFTGKRLVVRLMRCEIVNGGKDIRIVYPVGCSTGQAGMKPMKWISNSKTLLEGIPKEHRAKSVDKTRQRLPSTKTLGLTWHAESDKFQLKKPVMLRFECKIIGEKGLDWDDPNVGGLESEIRRWLENLVNLDKIDIGICLCPKGNADQRMHVFCDASSDAYAAVVYLTTMGVNGIRCS
ncbi:hypothetical protein BSL78_15488, partial [Apostichopus japonicus]